MGLELLTMSSYIVSSIGYILISMIKPPAMQLTAGTVADQRRDFIHGSRVQLAFFISVMTPLVVLIWTYLLEYQYIQEQESSVKIMYAIIVFLLVLYNIFNIFVFFADAISITKSDEKNRLFISQQKLFFWIGYAAIPLITLIFLIIVIFMDDGAENRVLAVYLMLLVLAGALWI